MDYETCELFKMIPKEEIDRVFSDSEYAGAEMCYSFLGFEDVYAGIPRFLPTKTTIIDLGCAYAAQAYYFTEYDKYIGVDIGTELDVHFEIDNMKFFHMSIQDFCKKVVTEQWNLKKVFAICSYVPDEEAREIVKQTFPYCLVYYPEW